MKYIKREYWSFKLISFGLQLLPKENRNVTYLGNCIKVGYIKVGLFEDKEKQHEF